MTKLVIVESPTKARILTGFLGGEYIVKASMGHVRDLPKSGMGVDMANNFQPEYLISEGKEKVVAELRRDAKGASEIILATDEDREGEAIAWHLLEALKINKAQQKVFRIAFHEITKSAIMEALETPRDIHMDMVDAQQARRILDRLVGYELSPLLWKKVRYGLSAGRVQSVATRMIVDREREIRAFIAVEYWTITADLQTPRGDRFAAELQKINGKKAEVHTGVDAEKIVLGLRGQDFVVSTLEKKEVRRNPAAPFTTSTLQQEASRKLGYSAKKTMMLAQRLYEGAYGEGLITYMRTDSLNLAGSAIARARQYIEQMYGADYVPKSPRVYRTKSKGAQEAHEAIRPTDPMRSPEKLPKSIDTDAAKLYALIWQRTIACQMEAAIMDQTGADIQAGICTFRATGQVVRFPGFLRVYTEGRDTEAEEAEDNEKRLPELHEGEIEKLLDITPEQHFTKPPARYTEATLVKKLEAEGIGRPSTYAPTISTIIDRGYVEKDGKQLKPTDTGEVVTDFLIAHFPSIVDYQFTAKMEEEFDQIAEGELKWTDVLKEFYGPFHETIEAGEGVSRASATQARELGNDPATGKMIYAKLGRFGAMLQMGETESEEKPRFAPLLKGQSIQSVTFEEALQQFQLPRIVGTTSEGVEVKAHIGRFGPYIQLDKTYVSIKEEELFEISLHDALARIADKQTADANKKIQVWEAEGVSVLNGRYGPYVTDGKKNGKIPKGMEPAKLTLEECVKILADAPEKKGGWGRKKGTAVKKVAAPKKKAPVKRKAAGKKK